MERKFLTDISEESKKHLDSIADYLAFRELNAEQIDRFKIGYIPDTKTILDCLKKNKWDVNNALEIGENLKILSKAGDAYSSFLANRIIFPIFDAYGRILGISGRVMDDRKPKYFNTVFQKGKHLYGLNNSIPAIIEENYVIIVEGYMDKIAATKIGVNNVVAIMGVALTDDHTTLLSRYTNKAFLLLDQDTAGQKSTSKYLEKHSPNPLMIDICPAVLPNGHKDLDEFIKIDKTTALNFLRKEIKKIK